MFSSNLPIDSILQTIRENRSSESNFATLQQVLDSTLESAQQSADGRLVADLQEIKEKYISEYLKATASGGTAWPEFEKFVTQFERVLTAAKRPGESTQ